MVFWDKSNFRPSFCDGQICLFWDKNQFSLRIYFLGIVLLHLYMYRIK